MSGQIVLWIVAVGAFIAIRAATAERVASRFERTPPRAEDVRALVRSRLVLIVLSGWALLTGAFAVVVLVRGGSSWWGWLVVAVLLVATCWQDVRLRARWAERLGPQPLTDREAWWRRRIERAAGVAMASLVVSRLVDTLVGRTGAAFAVSGVLLLLAIVAGGTAAWWALVAGGPDRGRAR